MKGPKPQVWRFLIALTMKDLGKKVEERVADMARVFEESAKGYKFS